MFPTSFDPIPYSFFIDVLLPFIIFTSIIVFMIVFVLPITCCAVSTTKRTRFIVVSVMALFATICWLVALKGVVGFHGSTKDIINVAKLMIDTLNDTSTNLDIITGCIDENEEEIELPAIFDDLNTYYDKYRPLADKWLRISRILLITFYCLMALLIMIYVYLLHKEWYKTRIVLTVCMSFFIFILYISLTPTAVASSSSIGILCKGNTTKNIKELATTFGIEEQEEYIDYILKCPEENEDDILLEFKTNLLEVVNNQTCPTIEEIVIATFEEIIYCEKLHGYYDSILNDITCVNLYESLQYTWWCIGLGTIFVLFMFIMSSVKLNRVVSGAYEML